MNGDMDCGMVGISSIKRADEGFGIEGGGKRADFGEQCGH
jgi:hypothetical protein